MIAAVLLVLGLGAGVWYINSGQFTRVPAVLGQTEAAATKRITDAGLDVGTTRRAFSDVYERGTVMAVDPAPGERLRGNGTVVLTLSRGPEIVKVPNLRNKPLAEARKALEEEGLAPGWSPASSATPSPRGRDRLRPRARHRARPRLGGRPGRQQGRPDRRARRDRRDRRRRHGRAPGGRAHRPGRPRAGRLPEDAGTVAAQSLPEGSRAAEGDTVTLTVSKGPALVEVPDVTGETTADARTALEDAGFEVKLKKSFPYLGDTVAGQSVEGGSTAPEGS